MLANGEDCERGSERAADVAPEMDAVDGHEAVGAEFVVEDHFAEVVGE